MFNIQKHLRHVVLALGLAAASLSANASLLPTYHISSANAAAAANIAYIDFVFGSFGDAAAATATLSHFVGNSLSEQDRNGDVTGTSDIVFGNFGPYNELYLAVSGPFAFDLNFSESFLGVPTTFGSNSGFSIVLYDASGNFIGDSTGALSYTLSTAGVDVAVTSSALTVPEPASLALFGLGLVGFGVARRKAARK